MASSSSSNKLLQVLTTPSKLASRLDWRKVNQGSILSLNIHNDRIGLALASHPSCYGNGSTTSTTSTTSTSTCHTLQSIPLARKNKVTEESKMTLANIVEQHKVCGFVVSWPLQPDSQRMGAACGRVLHTLEQLLSSSLPSEQGSTKKKANSPLISANRPCVLWNDSNAQSVDESDVFGRLEAYSKVPSSDKTVHIASIEQYNTDEATVASQVWEDFMRVHWPELHREQERQQLVASQEETHNTLLTQSAAIAAAAANQGSSSTDDAYYMQAAV